MDARLTQIKTANTGSIAAAGMQSDIARQSLLLLIALTALLLIPSTAFAGTTDPLTLTICTVVKWFSGPLGRSIATLGIVVLGIGALMGKISWGMAITVTVGISIMVGGGRIVELLTGEADKCAAVGGGGLPGAGAIADVLCNLASWVQQPIGRSLGTLAVIFLGISALFAKISYPQALVVGAGIGTFFKADALVDIIMPAAGGAASYCPVT